MRLPYVVRRAAGDAIRTCRLPILTGPNRGFRWSVASSGRGYLSGRFEPDRVAALLALVRPGDCVWDVGAHKGYLSLALSRRVGPAGRVVAIEPSQKNQWFLKSHLRWNGISNVTPVRAGVSDRSGQARFGGTGSTLAFRLGRGDETVRVATLAELVERDGLPVPDVLKIDTEGSEAAVLEGGVGVALRPGAVLLISVHARDLHAACLDRLHALGFRVWESAEMRRRTDDPSLAWGADHDLLAAGPERPLDASLLRGLGYVER